jgi:RNA polymerase sigma-70 factor (ECF subfamily)
MLHKPITGAKGKAEGHSDASPDEGTLVKRVAGGDDGAFEALYRCYYPRLRRFLERVTRRPQLVEEVLNDTMLVVWRKANTYNLRSKVSTWIFGIAFRRALKAMKRVDEPVDFDADSDVDVVSPGPESAMQQVELRAMLNRALSALSPEHRAVLELTYYEGHSCREIADIMGCPVDTVKTRMFHARRRLKVLIAARGGGAL